MDSCHLFNFLFGTKKATTELSKCFSSVVNTSTSLSGRSPQSKTRNNARKNNHCKASEAEVEAPLSPLKQLQIKIASLAPGSKSSKISNSQSEDKKETSVTCDAKCGTYRATLVELAEDHSLEEEDDQVNDDDYHHDEVKIIENPLSIDKSREDGSLVSNGKGNLVEENRDDNLDKENAPDRLIVVTKDTDIKIKQQARCRRVILYDDCELKQQQKLEQQQQKLQFQQQCQGQQMEPVKQIVASAEVYNMVVGDNKEKRAELRRVSSFVPDEYIDKDSIRNNKKVDSYDEDKRREHNHLQKCIEPQTSETDEKYNLEQLSEYDDNNNNNSSESIRKKICESSRDKRSVYVQSLVQSIELTGGFKAVASEQEKTSILNENEDHEEDRLNIGDNYFAKNDKKQSTPTKQIEFQLQSNLISSSNKIQTPTINNYTKPVTFVKPLPSPKTPVKTNRAKCLNMQISLNKPIKIQHLFQDESFLIKFFDKLEPLDRCVAAQVCRQWRNILYANQNYWKDLINVIDCTQLRRDYLVDCIINTLQSAKSKQQKAIEKDHDNGGPIIRLSSNQKQQQSQQQFYDSNITNHQTFFHSNTIQRCSGDSSIEFDQDEVWRIQELCNRYTLRQANHNRHQANTYNEASLLNSQSSYTHNNSNNSNNDIHQQPSFYSASKSSSIPSQISSTSSSFSLLSLSESSRMESIKEKLYNSLDNRGFNAICLFGATDDDIEDLISKMPSNAHKRITCGRLNNCCITNRGLDLFISTFTLIEEIELSGCNEITNCFDLKTLTKLKRLIITDCINIADGVAQKLIQIMHQLDELTIQAYHLTDAFIEYLSLNSDTSELRRLELPNCKEITNQSIVTIAKYFPNLELLSISGSTKITDDGIEVLAEQARKLKSLDLSWCSRITDASLECIACDLGDTITDLILDRNVHITDIGLGYLATMSKLTLLHIRWCPQITDIGLESILGQVKTLKYLSLAGIHQITARSLLYLIEADLLEEVELTNCPSVNTDLLLFLSTRLPKCNIIF